MVFPLGLKRAATLCVLKHKTSFLLLKRAKEPHQGKFTPLGGKIEPFESPLKAAIRETYEETGLELPFMKYQGILTESSPTKYNWICYTYVAEIDLIPPPPCPEGSLYWIEEKDIRDIPTPQTDGYIYPYILQQKPFAFTAEYDQNLGLISLVEEIEGLQLMG